MRRCYLSLLPWLVFDLALRNTGLDVDWASAIALGATATVVVFVGRGRPSPLDAWAALVFVSLFGLALSDHGGSSFRPDARGIATGACAVLFGASLLWTPLTERYVRSVTAPRQWNGAGFKQLNRKLCATWAASLALVGGSQLLAGHVSKVPVATTGLAWLIPLAVLVSLAVYTDGAIGRHLDADEPSIAELVTTFGELDELARASARRRMSATPHLHLVQNQRSQR